MDITDLTYTPPEVRETGAENAYPAPYGRKITVTTEKVNGFCPVSVVGDKLVINGHLYLDESEISSDLPNFWEKRPQLCAIALQTVFKYVIAMEHGFTAQELGLAVDGEDGFVMCPAWGPPTCEAAVIYRLHPEPAGKMGIEIWYEELAKLGYVSVPTFFLENFAPPGTLERRKEMLAEWDRLGRPKWWEGWDHPCQPRRPAQAGAAEGSGSASE